MHNAQLENGVTINYQLHGNKPDADSIVLISGFACDHKIWSFVIPILVPHFNVLVFDNRGIGLTQDDGSDFSIAHMANDVKLLLDHLKIKTAHIAGHSMGGLIAQHFAISYPEYLDKLVIINSSAYAHPTLRYALSNQNRIWAKNLLDSTELAEFILPWLFSNQFLNNPTYVQTFINSTNSNPTPQSITDNSRQLNALVNADLRNRLPQIVANTLIIASCEDLLCPPFINEALISGIKLHHHLTLPGGHISPLEQPDLLAKVIVEFVAQ